MRALTAVLLLVLAAPASAARLTLGSDLRADATIIESHGADSAFWPIAIRGEQAMMPEDGQVLSVTLKGTVYRERGAAQPLNMIFFQSLVPEGVGGAMRVWLSSSPFFLPIDEPNAITTYRPENLCVKKGGYVGFNDLGGFKYGGSLTAPLDHDHYHDGADFQIWGAVPTSATAHYTADNATKNGDILTPWTHQPHTPGTPSGKIDRGEEILMRYVIATGEDRSEPCGGPRRHADGSLVEPKPFMHVITPQRAYVTRDRRFAPNVYCHGPEKCVGVGEVTHRGRRPYNRTWVVARAPFEIAPASSGRINMRMTRRGFRTLQGHRNRGFPEQVKLTLITNKGEIDDLIFLTR